MSNEVNGKAKEAESREMEEEKVDKPAGFAMAALKRPLRQN